MPLLRLFAFALEMHIPFRRFASDFGIGLCRLALEELQLRRERRNLVLILSLLCIHELLLQCKAVCKLFLEQSHFLLGIAQFSREI